MNPRQIEILIEVVLSRRTCSASDRYKLCIVRGKLTTISTVAAISTDFDIVTLSELQIVNGFTVTQWAKFVKSITKYLEDKKLCLSDLTP